MTGSRTPLSALTALALIAPLGAGVARASDADLEREASRSKALEALIEAEQARQEALLHKINRAESLPAPDELDLRPELNLRADPRIATPAPNERELPLAVFEEEQTDIPAGAWGNARPLPVAKLVLDADEDGKPEQIRFYDPRKQTLLRLEKDRDYDGTLDEWKTFEGGKLAAREVDSDGDGLSDIHERYARDLLIERAIDRDADGVRDAFFVYDAGDLVEERHDGNNDGQTEVRIRYRNRIRLSAEEDRSGNGTFDTFTKFHVVDGQELVSRVERASNGEGNPDVIEVFEPIDGRAVISRREEDRTGDGKSDVTSLFESGKLVRRQFSDASFLPTQ